MAENRSVFEFKQFRLQKSDSGYVLTLYADLESEGMWKQGRGANVLGAAIAAMNADWKLPNE